MRFGRALTIAVVLVCFGVPLSAGVVWNWSGSSRSWNDSDMSVLQATLIGAGHTVLADSAITAGNLAGANVGVIGEAGAAPTAGETTTLSTWINAGGVLLVFFDSSCSGCLGGNPLLSALGTALQASSASASLSAFSGGVFATTGPPYDIVGQTLNTSAGSAISGGTALAGDFIHYQALGLGHVFAFADRSDHNIFNPTSGNANGKLFLNIVGHSEGGTPAVPEPSTLGLLGAGLAALIAIGRRRK